MYVSKQLAAIWQKCIERACFFVIDRIFLITEKSQFGLNVRKGRLVTTVTASVNTITGQMTEMF